MKWLPTGSWCWCWFFGNGIACIIERRLDLFHRELARVVAQVDRFRGNICRDHLQSWKRPQCSINGFHTMLTTHIGNGKGHILYICHTFIIPLLAYGHREFHACLIMSSEMAGELKILSRQR